MSGMSRHQQHVIYTLVVVGVAIVLLMASEALIGRAGARPGRRAPRPGGVRPLHRSGSGRLRERFDAEMVVKARRV